MAQTIISTKIGDMEAMVLRYTQDFPQHVSTRRNPDTDVALLTGSTGSLGSYILAYLLNDPSVSRVYALNRKDTTGSRSVAERQEEAFVERALDGKLAKSPKLVLLEGNLTAPDLGLGDALYNEIRTSITCIVHNAWPVNFNVSLKKMEPLIKGTRHLVDLSLRSPFTTPPRLVFTSSISVLKNWDKGPLVPEAPLEDAAIASGSGYSESKWVAETILDKASQQTPFRPVVVRVGQLSGGLNGSWTPMEWAPLFIRFSQAIGCVPRLSGRCTFIPVHVAAYALVEMRKSSQTFLHLEHPRPVSWSQITSDIAAALRVPLVSFSEWIAIIQDPSHPDPAIAMLSTQATRILDMFRNQVPKEDSVFDLPQLAMDAAIAAAPSLQSGKLRSLERRDVEEWISYWQSIGFCENTSRQAKL